MTELQKLVKKYKYEYNSYISMKARCSSENNNKNYEKYKNKKITICPHWIGREIGFINFIKDMGAKPTKAHTLDRKDNDGDYTPENCRWATKQEQNQNRTFGIMLNFNGKSQNIKDWSRELNISYSRLRYRLNNGWSIKKALTTIP